MCGARIGRQKQKTHRQERDQKQVGTIDRRRPARVVEDRFAEYAGRAVRRAQAAFEVTKPHGSTGATDRQAGHHHGRYVHAVDTRCTVEVLAEHICDASHHTHLHCGCGHIVLLGEPSVCPKGPVNLRDDRQRLRWRQQLARCRSRGRRHHDSDTGGKGQQRNHHDEPASPSEANRSLHILLAVTTAEIRDFIWTAPEMLRTQAAILLCRFA